MNTNPLLRSLNVHILAKYTQFNEAYVSLKHDVDINLG